MTRTILKSTERGQVTLPKQWRSAFPGTHFIASIQGKSLIITPLEIDMQDEGEEVIFDADLDNGGKGVTPDEMIRLIKKIRHG